MGLCNIRSKAFPLFITSFWLLSVKAYSVELIAPSSPEQAMTDKYSVLWRVEAESSNKRELLLLPRVADFSKREDSTPNIGMQYELGSIARYFVVTASVEFIQNKGEMEKVLSDLVAMKKEKVNLMTPIGGNLTVSFWYVDDKGKLVEIEVSKTSGTTLKSSFTLDLSGLSTNELRRAFTKGDKQARLVLALNTDARVVRRVSDNEFWAGILRAAKAKKRLSYNESFDSLLDLLSPEIAAQAPNDWSTRLESALGKPRLELGDEGIEYGWNLSDEGILKAIYSVSQDTGPHYFESALGVARVYGIIDVSLICTEYNDQVVDLSSGGQAGCSGLLD